MKIYLDDERTTPDGWTRTYNPKDTIDYLKTRKVTELSLDHDLGDDIGIGTGYDVLLWLEEEMYNDRSFPVPQKITVHSANPAASLRMNQAIIAIMRRWQAGLDDHNQ